MGNRLTRIYTRTGDQGLTGLADGSRLAKHDTRIAALGDIDELNSLLGSVISLGLASDLRDQLTAVQHDLFDLGAELCIPGRLLITDAYSLRLESWLDTWNEQLPALKEFVLPGGSPAAACCHQARCVCRRAERQLTALHAEQAVNPHTLAYINRLSDFLFVAARSINRLQRHAETLWNRDRYPV